MRWLVFAAATLALGCGGTTGGSVSVVLDIPNAVLDPMGYSSAEIRVHGASGDIQRSVAVLGDQFDLGEIDPMTAVSIEAVLRTDTGAAVGYGRTSVPADLVNGAQIVVPVRRPIAYIAGLVSIDQDGDPATNDVVWSEAPATFSDLSQSAVLDGSTTVGQNAVLVTAAGPDLFMVQQATSSPNGTLTGNATVLPISTGDHSVGTALAGTLTGGVLDGAGTDDGSLLVIGTTTQLFVVDTRTGTAKPIADGSFARVAIVSGGDGALTALAIKNRTPTTGTCQTSAELVWVSVNADDTNQVTSVATGGFADVAGTEGHGYYVDACSGELGEATVTGLMPIRDKLGRPTALAVSGTQAFIGVERPGTPAALSLLATSLSGSEAPRTLFSEPAEQVVEATSYPGVQRQLDAQTAVFGQL